jgi:hypothetical protein
VSVANMYVSGGSLLSTGEAMRGVHNVLNQKQNGSTKNSNDDRLLYVIRPFYQMTLNLLGVKQQVQPAATGHPRPILMGNIVTDIDDELEYARTSKNSLAKYAIYLCQGILAFSMNKLVLCRDSIEKCYTCSTNEMNSNSNKSGDVVVLASLDVLVRFYDAMSSIGMICKEANTSKTGGGIAASDTSKRTKTYLEIADRALSKLETYAMTTPALVRSKICIIRAELKVLGGQTNDALALYRTAMDHAVQYDNLYDRAVACERTGMALRVAKREDQALDYLEDCCGMYRAYGAAMKVNQITTNVIPDWNDDDDNDE